MTKRSCLFGCVVWLMIIQWIVPPTVVSQDFPLPFRLLSFDGDEMSQMRNHLYWTTFSEYKSDYFEVQRQTEDQPFKTIGTIDANGNTERITRYSFMDDLPVSGVNYYRLKLVDQNNAFDYSKIIALENKSLGEEFLLYPNRTPDYINLLYESDRNETYDIRIVSYSGQMLYDLTDHSSFNGTNRITIDVQDLPTGWYVLQMTRGGIAGTKSFLKQ